MIEIARRLADTVLFPSAQHVDRHGIPSTHFSALADAGLFDLTSLAGAEMRRVVAAIGGGCGATFFVWVQNHGVIRTLTGSPNDTLRDELLALCRAGHVVAGVAFAHVRRPGPPAVSATRADGGWRLDGHAPWATSWGIADRFCVAAESCEGDIVWSMIPGEPSPGVRTTAFDLPVFASTGTVAFDFDACIVNDKQVVAVEDATAWRAADRRRAALGQPAVMGITDRAVSLLAERGDDAADAAARLRVELDGAWIRDDELVRGAADIATEPPAEQVDDWVRAASDHRAACLTLARRSATALLAATGGSGMELSHPAQRLAREATFYVIQAQTGDGRAATLRRA